MEAFSHLSIIYLDTEATTPEDEIVIDIVGLPHQKNKNSMIRTFKTVFLKRKNLFFRMFSKYLHKKGTIISISQVGIHVRVCECV